MIYNLRYITKKFKAEENVLSFRSNLKVVANGSMSIWEGKLRNDESAN